MKLPRKKVSVKMFPSNTLLQIGVLDVSRLITNTLEPGPGFVGRPFLGPFLFDLSSGQVLDYREFEIEVSTFWEGSVGVGNENPFSHDCAFGILRDADGLEYRHSTHVRKDLESQLSSKQVVTEVRSLCHPDGDTECLDVYLQGETTKFATVDPIRLSKGFSCRWFHGNNLVGTAFGDGGKWRQVFWNPDQPDQKTYDLSSRILNLSNIELDRVSNTVSLRVQSVVEFGDGCEQTIKDTISVPVVYITPAILTPVEAGSLATSRLSSLSQAIKSDFYEVGKLTERNAVYRAAAQAVNGFSVVSVNSISYVKELFELKALIEPVVEILHRPMSVKNWTSLLLSWRYGWKLSWADTKALFDAFSSIKKSSKSLSEYVAYRNSLACRYGTYRHSISTRDKRFTGKCRANARVVARLELPIEDTVYGAITALIDDMGFRLSLTKMWDMVPMSFVYDWFIDIGGLFEKIDYSILECNRMTVRDFVGSAKNSAVSSEDAYMSLGFQGPLNIVTYTRRPSTELPAPFYGLEVGSLSSVCKHWWEGSLIILQKFAK